MKILCVIDSLGSGGAQRQLIELAIGFKGRGHNVSFLIYHEENFFRKLLDEANIQVKTIIEPNYTRRLIKMRKYIRSAKYDAVLSFLEAANFICEFSGLPRRKWKLVVGERSANPFIYRNLRLMFYRWFHLFSDYVVSNSHKNIEIVRKINPLLKKDKCKVIFNLVNPVSLGSRQDFIPINDGRTTIIVVASHQYLKNGKGLVQAVNHLDEEEKVKLKIDWYGDERTDASLKNAIQLVNKYGLQEIIKFYPASTDIFTKMKQADVVGLFSFYEGLPNVICESMVLGKPIISSAVSDIPGILRYDSNSLFNPNDANDIKRTLSHILSLSKDQLKTIGDENKRSGLQLFDKDTIISQYLKLFE